jgi:hypothetical protein
MRVEHLVGGTFCGVVVLALGASGAAAADKYCWKSNGKKVCVESSHLPGQCQNKPCVVSYGPGGGGNNKPSEILRPSHATAVAAKDDISVGLNLKTYDASALGASAKLNAQGVNQGAAP